MLWRVRTMLADRPGALAALAHACGEREVNILGLQIFPGVDGVTDELVLRTPEGWATADVASLVEGAGGARVSVGRCSEHALVDGPTRHLTAVRSVVQGRPVPEALADLLDADPAGGSPLQDVVDVDVVGHRVQVRRTAPFTGTEHARAHAFAELVADLVERGLAAAPAGPVPLPRVVGAHGVLVRPGAAGDAPAVVAMHDRCSADTVHRRWSAPLARLDGRLARRELVGGAGSVVASVSGAVVGLAALGEPSAESCELSLVVEDAWQRRGIGTRLLAAAARRAGAAGIEEVVLRGPAESPAAIAMVFGSGLRARVRLSGEELVVTVSTRGLGDPAAAGDRSAGTGRTGPVPAAPVGW